MIEKQEGKEVKKEKNLKQIFCEINNALKGDVIENLAYASIIIIYLIFLNIQNLALPENTLTIYINVASMVFLSIAILIMEVSYKKEDDHLIMFALEYLSVSIFVLLAKYMPKLLNFEIKKYIIMASFFITVYYILKLLIKYTLEKQKELKSLSDIKEIVKKEPFIKHSKRKNIKE